MRAFRSLKRQPVPDDLEGRVVAAMYPGHRQDRALSFLTAVSQVTAPGELDDLVRETVGGAPRELDQRVERELDDPTKAQTLRMTRKLARPAAPESLRERVEDVLERGPGGQGWARPRRWAGIAGGLVAVALLVWVAGPLGDAGPPAESPNGGGAGLELATLSLFEVVDVEYGTATMNGMAMGIVDGMVGGPSLAEEAR